MQWSGHWAVDWNLTKEGEVMKNEQKPKKGFWGMLRESFSKTGGCCCGPGEACGKPIKEGEQRPKQESAKTAKSAQK